MPLDCNGYPTDGTLLSIEEFVIKTDLSNLPEYISLVVSHWAYADWGVKYDKNTGELELHTAGWSGNESIMRAMQKTRLFWSMFWMQSRRGGHYYFELFQFDGEGKRCLPMFEISDDGVVWW